MKNHLTISIDEKVLAEVRFLHLPLSAICEKALREALPIPADEREKEALEQILAVESKKREEIIAEHKKALGWKEKFYEICKDGEKRRAFINYLRGKPTMPKGDSVEFWEKAYELAKDQSSIKESTPAPPKEKGE